MRKKNQLGLLTVIFLFVIMFAASQFVGANPEYTQECSGCHTTTGTLGLSSNATGTISATQYESFILTLTADGGSGALKIVSDWADNSEFTISTTLVEDNDATDDDDTVGVISVDVTFTPNSVGEFTIRVWVASTGLFATSLDVTVDVEQATTTPTVTTTTTTTTTETTPTDDTQERIAIWEFMMMTLIPASGVILVLLGVIIIRRAN